LEAGAQSLPEHSRKSMSVKQAANVLELLEYFARERRPATLSEIAGDLGWPRSSTFNLLGTLIDMGYLYEPRTRGGYYPTPRWLMLAQQVAEAEPLPEAILAMVTEIAQETGETTAIAGPAGTSLVFLHVVESPSAIRYFAHVGGRLPIHATATGRAILSQYTGDERQALYRKIRFEKYARNTLTSIDEVEAEIRRAHQRGFFISRSEFTPDLCGVAITLPLAARRLALLVAGPEFRCADHLHRIAETMKRALHRYEPLLAPASP
jgi:IclR family acetate operon transcriptional repressor